MVRKMKNQYRIALLKSKVCLVANCTEETDPQRDKHAFVIAEVCVLEKARKMVGYY